MQAELGALTEREVSLLERMRDAGDGGLALANLAMRAVAQRLAARGFAQMFVSTKEMARLTSEGAAFLASRENAGERGV